MIAAFTLWEIPVHDGHRLTVFVREFAPDEAALGVLFIGGKAFIDAQRRLTGQQRDAVMAFLAMELHVIPQRFNVSERELFVTDFGFLQADHVRLMFFDQRCQLMRPSAQAVDVE